MKKQNKFLKTIDKIISILLIVFIIVGVFSSLFFTYYRSQNKLVNLFGYSVCYVVTGSMEPALEVGDVIIIKRVPANEIQEDDIITYLSTEGLLSGNYITHRVIDKIEAGETFIFTTKGDANLATDTEAVTSDKVQGVYVKKFAVVKFLISILSNPINFVLFIIVPLIITFAIQIINFVLDLKKEEQE